MGKYCFILVLEIFLLFVLFAVAGPLWERRARRLANEAFVTLVECPEKTEAALNRAITFIDKRFGGSGTCALERERLQGCSLACSLFGIGEQPRTKDLNQEESRRYLEILLEAEPHLLEAIATHPERYPMLKVARVLEAMDGCVSEAQKRNFCEVFAKRGDVSATTTLYTLLKEKSPTTLASIMEDLCAKGNLQAMALWGGQLFAEGKKGEGFKWLEKSAREKNPEGLYQMAQVGLSQSNPNAGIFLRAAAELGHRKAQMDIAKLLLIGKRRELGIPMNEKFRQKLMGGLKTSAEAGDAKAQYLYAQWLSEKAGNIKEERERLYTVRECYAWLEKASAQGYAEATYEMATNYHLDDGTNTANLERARSLLRRAAAQGHEKAKKMTYYFENPPKGPTLSTVELEWHELNARFGVAASQYALGVHFAEGAAIGSDGAKKAFEWFEKAAGQDYADAEYRLGKCYGEGFGVDKSKVQAERYYLRAARHGSAAARRHLSGQVDRAAEAVGDALESLWSL